MKTDYFLPFRSKFFSVILSRYVWTMGDHMPISHLRPEMAPSSINVVGVVISAERPRAPPTKFGKCLFCVDLGLNLANCSCFCQPHLLWNVTFSPSRFVTNMATRSMPVAGALSITFHHYMQCVLSVLTVLLTCAIAKSMLGIDINTVTFHFVYCS